MQAQFTTQERIERAEQIALLNDAMRKNISNPQGFNRVVITQGVAALITDTNTQPHFIDRHELNRFISNYEDFGEGNDPHQERDFGGFEFKDKHCFWKIDYYSPDLRGGSSDPTNPAATARVLTIGTMSEY